MEVKSIHHKGVMSFEFPVEIAKIKDDEGNGYCAAIPELGENTFIGDGSTPFEAVENLRRVSMDMFEDLINYARGIKV